jgi:hypothetical protein
MLCDAVPGLPGMSADRPQTKMSNQNVKVKLAIAENNTQGKLRGN